ncbi:carbon-nitrogen family hydrolase [Alteribacillus sp. HJP-4]|uniref:carbon-nitrogen family hydrolase n=1 Tax=Alteribacillus sp. HJP-4 TaxID=2775394 RepID=UPI0035CD3101
MKLSVIQLEIKNEESRAERISRVDNLLSGLKDRDMIILPEVWATGYFSFDRYIEEAEAIDGEFVNHYSGKARELSCYLFAGSFIEQDGGNYYNTSIMFSPNGELIGTYRKIHLFRYGSREGEILTRGYEPTVVTTPFGRIGMSTCYDLRFPELYRAQVDAGAELFLVTSAWPHQRLDHWNTFNVARALENQGYLISCNCTGTTNRVKLGGHSQVVDPWGRILEAVEEEETILTTAIDTSEIGRVRETFPQLKHRVIGMDN